MITGFITWREKEVDDICVLDLVGTDHLLSSREESDHTIYLLTECTQCPIRDEQVFTCVWIICGWYIWTERERASLIVSSRSSGAQLRLFFDLTFSSCCFAHSYSAVSYDSVGLAVLIVLGLVYQFNNLDVHAVLIAVHCVTNMHSDISYRAELLELNTRINVSI